MSVFDDIKRIICSDELAAIEELNHTLVEMANREQILESKLRQEIQERGLAVEQLKACMDSSGKDKKGLLAKIADLEEDSIKLKNIIKEREEAILLQQRNLNNFSKFEMEIINSYWNKYASASITYKGRFLKVAKNPYSLDVKAFCLEGQNDDAIIKRVREADAYVLDIMDKEKCSFHKACDISIMRVAEAFNCFYKYDKDTWGTSEFWMFPSETEAYGKGDCDDMSTWRYAGWRIAGIPEQLLRVACGLTYNNEGHSTNYYLASDMNWRHINSTSNFNRKASVLNLKRTHDPSDSMAIKDVWFSFTESKAWHELSVVSGESLNSNARIKKDFVIKGD